MMAKLCEATRMYQIPLNLLFAYKIINAYNEFNMLTLKHKQALRSTITKKYIH